MFSLLNKHKFKLSAKNKSISAKNKSISAKNKSISAKNKSISAKNKSNVLVLSNQCVFCHCEYKAKWLRQEVVFPAHLKIYH